MQTNIIRIGAVNYVNTKPLIYGFEQGICSFPHSLQLAYPSKLASMLQKDEVDIALLPVAAIPTVPDAHIFSNYCIGAAHEVASVCLFSNVPIDEIQEIYLDYQSRTSVALLRILLHKYWKIRPVLLPADENYIDHIQGKTAGVIIGDRALIQYTKYTYVYDLAKAWNDYTGLPFVFATWVSNRALTPDIVDAFNETNAYGLHRLPDIIAAQNFPWYDLAVYYQQNIHFTLDEPYQHGMRLFLNMLDEL